MGNVCSFDSPDLVRTVAVAAAGGAVAVIPTFAASVANLAFLSVTGSFTGTPLFAPAAQPTVCSFPTNVDGSVASITPYIIGSDNVRTNCDAVGLAASVNGVGSTTFTGPVSCPSVFLNDLPIGTYQLEFDSNIPSNVFDNSQAVSIVTNTFSWTTPLTASTVTLSQSTVTVSTSSDVTQTDTVTVSPEGETSTTTITTATSTDTVYAPGQKKSTVFTATTTRTSTSTACKTLPQSTVTKYSCPTSPAYCSKGAAPKDLTKCPAADHTCYTSSNNHVYELECGTDRPGKDLTMKKCTTMEVCLATCSKTSGCNAVAYYPADRRCYLKSSSGSAVKNSQVVGARLVSKYSKKERRGTINLGGNPDFTYPPTPTASTATVTPTPTTITQTGPGDTVTQTSTVTGDSPASTSIVTVDEGSITTVTSKSTITVSAKKTVYKTITATSNVSPKATTVTEKKCSTRKGYGYGY